MTTTAVEAIYTPSDIAPLAGNPCVEALGPILSREAWAHALMASPPFNPADRDEDGPKRKEMVLSLRECFVPLPPHIEVAEKLAQAIRTGYAGRSPISGETAQLQKNAYERLHSRGQPSMAVGVTYSITTLSVIGHSGMGKSTNAERILGCYPKVIYHPEHGFYQLVWIKVDCPRNGSIKGLAKAIVAETDKAMNTAHQQSLSSRMSEDDIILLVQRLIVANNIGILVVDEIQNLIAMKSGGREAMINFFQEICNTLKLPVVLMGTNEAFNVLGEKFRIARRTGTLGMCVWDPLANDRMWHALVRGLLRYQWVREPVECSDELTAYLHDRTQGIPAVLSQLLIHAQQRAIHNGQETLSYDLFDDVLRYDLPLVQDMLAALRSNDPRRYAEYADIRPTYISPVLVETGVPSVAASPVPRSPKKNDHPAETAVANLISMGYEREDASAAVKSHWDSGVRKAPTLTERALKSLAGGESSR